MFSSGSRVKAPIETPKMHSNLQKEREREGDELTSQLLVFSSFSSSFLLLNHHSGEVGVGGEASCNLGAFSLESPTIRVGWSALGREEQELEIERR